MFISDYKLSIALIPLLTIVFSIGTSNSAAIASPLTAPSFTIERLNPVLQKEFEPDNNGSPDSTGAGSR